MVTPRFGSAHWSRFLIHAMLILSLTAFGAACAESGAGVGGGGGGGGNNGNGGGGGNGGSTKCSHPTGGACDFDTLRYCVGDSERTVQCDELFEGGTCRRVGITAWCHVPVGQECVINEDAPVEAKERYVRCNHETGGCVADGIDEPAICQPNIGSCTASQVKSCLPGNQYYVFGCLDGQPRVYDCAAKGGRCSGGVCRDLEEGADCQIHSNTNRYMLCADDLKCVGETDLDVWGTCVPK